MRSRDLLRTVITAFTVAAVVYAVRTKQPEGRLLGVPYDFRFPTLARLRDRVWNPDDRRLITPQVFGVGWGVNLYELRRRLQRDEPTQL
jgi:uncharacterized membrane protein